MARNYKCTRTTALFAALNILDGTVIARARGGIATRSSSASLTPLSAPSGPEESSTTSSTTTQMARTLSPMGVPFHIDIGWVFNALEHSRRFQRCLDTGHRNCVDFVDR
jgi:hypothetical protein